MIELVSVEVENFRSFGHATFTPLGPGQGLTAINGANGSGKSSIATTALLWALYGQTPDGVAVRALRRQGSTGDVRVTVTFRHDNQTIVVTRALRGRNDTTTAGITVDGVEQTNMSSKTATTWVTGRLGIDAEAFTTAFVIPQKDVDGLVRARPAERRAIIERLAGIDRMSTALTKARERARHAGAAADAFGPAVDLDQYELTARETATTAKAAKERAFALRVDADIARDTAVAAASNARAVEDAEMGVRDTNAALQLAEQALQTAETDLERTRTAAIGADLLTERQTAASAANDERVAAEQTARAVEAAQTAAEKAERAAETAQAEAERLGAAATTAENVARDTTAAIPPAVDTATVITDQQTLIEQVTEQRGGYVAEQTRLQNAIRTLSHTHEATGSGAACPTCATVLTDTSELIGTFETQISRLTDDITNVDMVIRDARTVITEQRELAEARETAVTAADRARQTADNAHTAAEHAAETAATLIDAAETAAEHAHAASIAAETALANLPRLIEASNAAQRALRETETAVEAADRIPSMEQTVTTARTARDTAHTAHAAAVDVLNTFNITVTQARTAADTARTAADTAEQAANTAEQDTVRATGTATQAAQTLADAQTTATARETARQVAETAATTAAAMEEFRRDRLARLAPELSEVASDIIATMTEGRYTTVELDEDFTPVLTEAATGLQRPTAWLSGGEESAVALALRIAIGDVISGQHGGLLILDEVLTAQDKQRRAAVMSAIRALAGRQVITINHVSEATDMVDLVATVIPDAETGSTIDHTAGDDTGNVSEALIDAA